MPWHMSSATKAEQAYRRSDALEKRRGLTNAWAAFVEPQRRADVIQLRTFR